MPSLVDLVGNHLLRNLTDPDTYDAGVDLADRGAVEFDELGPLHARARVEDGPTFVADLKSGPGKLIWSCSEPGGSWGALCRHCVAAAVDTWRRAPARASNAGSREDDEAGRPLRLVQPAPADQVATPLMAGRPPAHSTAVEEDVPVTSEPAPTAQAEHVTAAVRDGEQTAPPARPNQPASPVLMRSSVQEPSPPPTAGPTPRSAPVPSPTLDLDAAGITGIHAIVFTPAVAQVRAFFRDVLGLPNVDAGDGWLIFALPPAELAVHPADAPSHEIYLMCDDIEATLTNLEHKGVGVRRPVREEAWGFVTEIVLVEGADLAIYQPKHPSPLDLPREPPS
jgi:predicted enzyme related to lactoylglutathione lyase